MKKVLIISFYLPPSQNIGAQRAYKLAKFLPEFGWEPIVLTIKVPDRSVDRMRIIETDYKDIVSSIKSKFGLDSQKGLHEQMHIHESKNYDFSDWRSKIIKFVREVIAFPDDFIGWQGFAIKSACDLLDKEHIDAMISTSYPVTSHVIASRLKKKYKIPWVADFRDLWTQNHYVKKYKLIYFRERALELKTLLNADLLVTVHPLEATLHSLHKNKKILCITNGYDPDDFPERSFQLTNKFTITYTGILYAGKRDPAMLFNTVRQLIDENKISKEKLNIRFYGPKEQWLYDEVKKYNLETVVSINGTVTRDQALQIQRESQILLILSWNNKDEERIYPGKLFEYFGAKRPIIAIGAGGVIRDILERTNAGRFAENEIILKDILLQYYHEFIEYGEVRYCSNPVIDSYTYNSIAQRYSEVLNNLPCS